MSSASNHQLIPTTTLSSPTALSSPTTGTLPGLAATGIAGNPIPTGTPIYLGIDIGGTKIAAGLVGFPEAEPQVWEQKQIPTDAADGGAAVLDRVCQLATSYLNLGLPIKGIGIASAGVINVAEGKVASATDLMPGWTGQPLTERVEQSTGLPTTALNDVVAHGLGEAAYGAGRTHGRVLSVAVGTGMGGSFIVNGRPVLGAHCAAGHIGHVPHPLAAGITCSCGTDTGHIESVASGTGLTTFFNSKCIETGLAPVNSGLEFQTLVDQGQPVAVEVLTASATALGQSLAGVVHTIDPDVVVLSGSVVKSGPLWWQALRTGFQRDALPVFKDIQLVAGTLGGVAPLVGAVDFFVSRSASQKGC